MEKFGIFWKNLIFSCSFACTFQTCGFMIMFQIFTMQTVETELVYLLSEPDTFADFTYLGSLSTQNGNVVAITVFLAWVKVFKYLSFNRTMMQLTGTLKKAGKDMAGFIVIIFIAFFSYALFGMILFGPDVSLLFNK